MAFERVALFALSIAFTTSIVLYPDLPPDIPPRAGRHGPFIGAPFVTFFLPITAIALWRLLVSLHRSLRSMAPAAARAGAVVACFLSVFHVTMMAGFVGAHPWLTRVLGAIVGVFLIVTGNDLPRTRPVMAWGLGTLNASGRGSALRAWRAQRLVGHVRVFFGSALTVAALAGMPAFFRLIVAAVCLEAVLRVTLSVLGRRAAQAVTTATLILAGALAASAHAQDIPAERIDVLPSVVDATVPKLMGEAHVLGTALTIVHRGRLVLLRGYGRSRLEPDTPVDPTGTAFRIGSVSKTLTAIAALQLAEAGVLDLHRDVRQYLPDVPLRFGATMHQLLTHTAGLDERFAGAYTDSAEHLDPLSDYVRRHPPVQVVPPGTGYSYSNYHYAVAGVVIERLSGRSFEQYIEERVFGPLAMSRTTAYQPPRPSTILDLAKGYAWRNGRYELQPARLTFAGPSGGMTTTAPDMARVMLALLGDGSVDGRRVLSPASVNALLAQQYTPHPRIPATAYGMTHWVAHGQRLLHKDGTLGDQIGVLVLAPASGLGIFAASNAVPGVANTFLNPVLTHLFGPEPPAQPPVAMLGRSDRLTGLAGTYRNMHHTRNDMSRPLALMFESRVTIESDGVIGWQGRRWLEVEPFVFTSADGRDTIVFRENEAREIAALHAWGATYERIGWAERRTFHLGVLAMCVTAFVAYPLSRGRAAFRRGVDAGEGRVARRSAVVVAVANVAFTGWLVTSVRGLGASVPLPLATTIALSVPLVTCAITSLLPGFAAVAWREGWWTRSERVAYSVFAACSVAFMVFLNYWKVLGVRY